MLDAIIGNSNDWQVWMYLSILCLLPLHLLLRLQPQSNTCLYAYFPLQQFFINMNDVDTSSINIIAAMTSFFGTQETLNKKYLMLRVVLLLALRTQSSSSTCNQNSNYSNCNRNIMLDAGHHRQRGLQQQQQQQHHIGCMDMRSNLWYQQQVIATIEGKDTV